MSGLPKLRWPAVALGIVCLSLALQASAARSKGPPRTLTRAQLADGFAIGSGQPALGLRVEIVDGQVVSATPTPAAEANLRAVRGGDDAGEDRSKQQTLMTVSADLPLAVKYDLYMSADGETFVYTSSCVLTPGISAFESWPHPVREFAIGRPRVVPEQQFTCE
ncbi:MAG: hypothetical protein ACREO7_04690 [Pseudoxanthomonas sp.]